MTLLSILGNFSTWDTFIGTSPFIRFWRKFHPPRLLGSPLLLIFRKMPSYPFSWRYWNLVLCKYLTILTLDSVNLTRVFRLPDFFLEHFVKKVMNFTLLWVCSHIRQCFQTLIHFHLPLLLRTVSQTPFIRNT